MTSVVPAREDPAIVQERIARGEAELVRAVAASSARNAAPRRPALALVPAVEESDDA
jgi:hypothetical protein